MAEIDFRIPLQARGVQTRSIAPTLLALGQLQRGQQRGQINEALLAKGEAEAARQQQLAQILASQGGQPGLPPAIDVPFQDVSVPQGQTPGLAFPGQPQQPQQPQAPQQQTPGQQLFDRTLPARLIGGGLFDAAETVLRVQKLQIENRTALREGAAVKRTVAVNLLSTATDEASYQLIRPRFVSMLQGLDLPAAMAPLHFDEKRIDALLNLNRTEDQQFARDKQEDVVRLKEIDQGNTQVKEARLAREGAGKLPPRLASLSAAVKGIIAGQGGLGPSRFATEKEITAAVEADNLQTLKEMGERARLTIAGRALPADVRTSLGQVGELRRLLRVMRENFEPGTTGFVAGPKGELLARFTGKTTEKGIRFRQALALATEIWSRAQSGAAIAGSELAKFKTQIPAIGDSGQIFLGKNAGMDAFLQNREETIVRLGTLTVGETRELAEQGISPIPQRQPDRAGETQTFPTSLTSAQNAKILRDNPTITQEMIDAMLERNRLEQSQ